ncbi:MAG: transporter [Flavobacteriaceae bacterium]|nr:transporter [Flavobacteriaceae bacterium]
MLLTSLSGKVFSQYTEVINANRPGESQGAYAVGKNILQFELSPFYGREEHDLQRTESDIFGLDFAVRYGFFREQLEVIWNGSFQSVSQTDNRGLAPVDRNFSNFRSNTFGVKYLVYDPFKFAGFEQPNIRSWKANTKFTLKDLIPAVSVYAGLNIMEDDNPLSFPGDELSPKFAIMTQNNLPSGFNFVTNFILDKSTTDFSSFSFIATLTYSAGNQWAYFGEFETTVGDFYSDELLRGGLIYLFTKDFQVDLAASINFKDTPSVFRINAGIAYRFDMHRDDTKIFAPETKAEKKDRELKETLDKKKRRDGFDAPENE